MSFRYQSGGAWQVLSDNQFAYVGGRLLLESDSGYWEGYLTGDGATDTYARFSTNSGDVQWLVQDSQGSVRNVVSGDGATVLDQIDYDAYGNVVSESAPTLRGTFGYTGLPQDSAVTGLVFAANRELNTATGQWLENDPIYFGGGTSNVAEYVGNDPVNGVDPSGLQDRIIGPPSDSNERRKFDRKADFVRNLLDKNVSNREIDSRVEAMRLIWDNEDLYRDARANGDSEFYSILKSMMMPGSGALDIGGPAVMGFAAPMAAGTRSLFKAPDYGNQGQSVAGRFDAPLGSGRPYTYFRIENGVSVEVSLSELYVRSRNNGDLFPASISPLGRGLTANIAKGTSLPRNLREMLAVDQVISNPAAGQRLPLKMTDTRWHFSDGWVKMQQKVQPGGGEGKIIVHYVYNTITKQIDDFKIVLPGER